MEKNLVFIYGLWEDSQKYKPLMQYFRKKRFKCYGFEYEKQDDGTVPLEEIAKKLKSYLDKLKQKYVLVGLSQGGLIAAYYLEFLGGKSKCNKCFTICTPFYGTYSADLLSKKGIKELRPGSDFLKKLRAKIKKSRVRYYTVWNPLDFIVFPGKNARLKNGFSKKVISPLHMTTYWSDKTKNFIEKGLAGDSSKI